MKIKKSIYLLGIRFESKVESFHAPTSAVVTTLDHFYIDLTKRKRFLVQTKKNNKINFQGALPTFITPPSHSICMFDQYYF